MSDTTDGSRAPRKPSKGTLREPWSMPSRKAATTSTGAKRPRGRPTPFRAEFRAQATRLCMLGAIDEEMADFFGVDVRTIYRWKKTNPDFCQAIKEGKIAADKNV